MPNSFRIGEFHVEPSLYRVSGPAEIVRLEPKVMHVLLCLTEHSHEVVSKEVGIYRLRMSDRAVERVADLRGVWTSDMDSCSFEGLAPDDAPLILCFRNDRDVYAPRL